MLVLCAAVALAACPVASADVAAGVADDSGKYAEDGGAWFFSTMRAAGLTENRMTILWDPAHPATILDRPFLDRSLPVAAAHGVRVVFAVYPVRATGLTDTAGAPEQFAAFLTLLART
jgi:hypothetical protein